MKLSGYTTIRNAKSMGYPFIESIKSMLSFCDEVVVLDSSDCEETIEALDDFAEKEPSLIVVEATIPWNDPNHGIYDGQTKAMARGYCTGDVLWQMDADEIVHESDGPKIRKMAKDFYDHCQQDPNAPKILILPVTEFWGPDKIRADINPWKPRMSIHDENIVHGIPKSLLKIEDGLLYAKHGTDGCDYIDRSMNPVYMRTSYMPVIEEARRAYLTNPNANTQDVFTRYFHSWIQEVPGVYHYSWYSIPEKILKYKYFWNNSWKSLYNENRDPNWNPFIDKSLNDITDDEIIELGLRLENETGGWIFHQKWDGTNTPSIPMNLIEKLGFTHPAIISEWRSMVDQRKLKK
jgi:glycosyltransferase involved in cell wall biosynthesis